LSLGGLSLASLGGCAQTPAAALLEDAGVADAARPDAARPDAARPDAALADATASEDGSLEAGSHARLVLVNGSPNAPALRFCFGSGDPTVSGTALAAVPAEPDDDLASSANGLPYPGVFTGSGAPAPDPGADWSLTSIAIYAIDAERIRSQVRSEDASQANCRALLGADGDGGLLVAETDYWYLGSIPKGTMVDGTSWLSAIVGCLPGIADAGPPCDAMADGAAPAMGALWELDNVTAIAAGAVGAQFANASFGGGGTGLSGSAGFQISAAGGGAPVRAPIATAVGPGGLAPASLATVDGVTLDGSTAFYFSATGPDGGAVDVASSLPVIQEASWGATPPDGAAFASGGGYVFVLVGDPTLAQVDTSRAAHWLAFPTSPPFGSP
jgi:hypothetical protein